MASEVDIANRALSMLGELRITSLSDNNKPARAMDARYELLRDSELESHMWRFAIKRVQLAASVSTPAWGYSTIYDVPSDNIRATKIGGSVVNAQSVGIQYEATGYSTYDEAPYEIIEGKIQTNLAAPLDYEYIARITDTGQFSPLFVEALAARLAYDAAEELTQSDTKKLRAMNHYKQAMSEARRNNALLRPPRRRTTGRWMASRVSG